MVNGPTIEVVMTWTRTLNSTEIHNFFGSHGITEGWWRNSLLFIHHLQNKHIRQLSFSGLRHAKRPFKNNIFLTKNPF